MVLTGRKAPALLTAVLLAAACSRGSAELPERDPAVAPDEPASTTEPSGDEQVALVALARARRPVTLEDKLADNVDPARDGWNTEVLSDAAGSQLEALAGLLESPGRMDREAVAEIVADAFTSPSLRPTGLDDVHVDAEVTVRRWNGVAEPARHHGPRGFVDAVKDPHAGSGDRRVALKLFQIEEDEAYFSTRVLFEASRRTEGGRRQENALWRCRWSSPEKGVRDKPRLLGIELESYEEVHLENAEGTLFSDCTASAMGANPSYREQVLPGINHWLTRVSLLAGMSIVGHHGLAVGDVDGDGLEDLYVCDAAGLPNRLYLQNPDGTVDDASSGSGVDWLEASTSALLVDLDNDGDQDLAVATRRRLLLSENDGRGRFTLRVARRDVVASSASLSAADYDDDGDLDLYLCGYDGDPDNKGLPGPMPYHDARNGGANALLENRGDFRFADVTAQVGLDDNNDRFSFAAAWDDYDGDGDLDLYVANDFGRNNLYQNDGGRFTDVAARAGVEDVASGMSAAWGDYDRDGRMDVYVSNMFSSAGNRVAYQRSFTAAAPDDTAADLQRMARGNTLFRNAGGASFRDVSVDAGATMGRWAWASKFADLNNDRWPDLVVTNGYVTNEDTGDL